MGTYSKNRTFRFLCFKMCSQTIFCVLMYFIIISPNYSYGIEKIEIVSFDFVTLQGRPGHQGLLPIQGSPIIGPTSRNVEAVLSGPFSTAEFSFIEQDGALISNLLMQQDISDPNRFVGSVTLPEMPFHVKVNGLDEFDNPYEKIYWQNHWLKLFTPQTIEILFLDESILLMPGTTNSFTLRVTNYGESGHFSVGTKGDIGYSVIFGVNIFELDGGQYLDIGLDIVLPAGVKNFTKIPLEVTVYEKIGLIDFISKNTASRELFVDNGDYGTKNKLCFPIKGRTGNTSIICF